MVIERAGLAQARAHRSGVRVKRQQEEESRKGTSTEPEGAIIPRPELKRVWLRSLKSTTHTTRLQQCDNAGTRKLNREQRTQSILNAGFRVKQSISSQHLST